MSRKQLMALFICNMIPFIVGNSLMALLPIYITNELNMSSVATGVMISIAFAALAISTSVTPGISRWLGQRTALIRVSAMICIPVVWLLGQTHQVTVFTLLLTIVWFLCGIQIVMTHILTALNVDTAQRGRAFGVLVAAGSLSQLISGLTAGQVVSNWGYETLFLICAGLYVISILATYIIEDGHDNAVPSAHNKRPQTAQPMMSTTLLLLMGASILAHIASFSVSMARPLVMDALKFDPSAITSVIAVGGLISLPMPVIAGWLSDRSGRIPILIVVYVLTAVGAGFFIVAESMWHFWIAQALSSVLACSMVVGTALVTDSVSRENIDTNVARFSTTPWIGAVVGSTTGGMTMSSLGAVGTFQIAVVLLWVAIILVFATRLKLRLPDRLVLATQRR